MFVAQSGKPVLIGLLAGSAANIAMDVDIRDEEVSDEGRSRDNQLSIAEDKEGEGINSASCDGITLSCIRKCVSHCTR